MGAEPARLLSVPFRGVGALSRRNPNNMGNDKTHSTTALCIITARGGSKRIPRKNIRLLDGMPAIGYPIGTAQRSGCFSEIMVSTEDAEIAAISREQGANVPFLRSSETAGDRATTADVLVEVLERYRAMGRVFDMACCIYPLAILMREAHLRNGREMLESNPALSCVMPVLRFGYPIQRALAIRDGLIEMIRPEFINAHSQTLEPAYHDAGQWYWFRPEQFLRERQIIGNRCGAIILDEMEAQDVDHEGDWKLLNAKLSAARDE